MGTCAFYILKQNKVEGNTELGKISGISRKIRVKINVSVTKSQFPENNEKYNNSSPHCPTFGHNVLLRASQKHIYGNFEILTFYSLFAHFGSKLAFLVNFDHFLHKKGVKYHNFANSINIS